jgi:Cu(I)/Ag(I) efflux system membrane fusion protein
MSGHNEHVQHQEPIDTRPRADDEGGLRAPPGLRGWRKWWWWFDFIILVKLARLRFIGILVAIGFVITQWDTLLNYYDRWTRRATATEATGRGDMEFFCPMHPTVIRDTAKEKCPICFMPLSKRKKGEGRAEVLPAGVVNRVQLSPYRVALAGVQSCRVDYQALTRQIAAVGYVDFNERFEKTVSARVTGRIDQLLVNETGRAVKEGDELASIYSPDLVVTTQNLLDAKQTGNRELLEAARTRLQLLGIGDDQIERQLASGKADLHLKIRSPISGRVIKKYVREGQYVREGTPLYDVADLSTVWIQAQVYEDDLAFLPGDMHGQSAPPEALAVTATTRAFPNEPFRGTLAFVYPHADQATRTVTVRFEMQNPQGKLRPGTTATVTLNVEPARLPAIAALAAADAKHREMLAKGRALAVPESAVIDTGRQKIVYREATPGVYEGVLVQLGPRMTAPDGAPFFPVLRGLEQGDVVVASGSFLVDAETRLNPAAGSIYFGGSSGSKGAGPSVTTVRPTTPEDADAKIAAALAKLPAEDRPLAEAQRFCPVLEDSRLGSMGPPVKLMIDGQPVFLCCKGCERKALANPQATLARVQELKKANAGAK